MRASNQQLHAGVIVAGIALVAFLLVNQLGGPRQLGWFMALPLVASSYMVISGIFGICIVHGLRGDRQADHGQEVVLDPASRARIRKRAMLAVSASIIIGCSFTAAFVAHG
ncbi:MAG TPA: hypothetical protein VJV79_30335 [Polyangiaceae bacterium]|nr:hypothetical protein [Polyangiaceae bacterium]